MKNREELVKAASVMVNAHSEMEEFENAIRKVGIVSACEWFGYSSDSEFTQETISILEERSQQ